MKLCLSLPLIVLSFFLIASSHQVSADFAAMPTFEMLLGASNTAFTVPSGGPLDPHWLRLRFFDSTTTNNEVLLVLDANLSSIPTAYVDDVWFNFAGGSVPFSNLIEFQQQSSVTLFPSGPTFTTTGEFASAINISKDKFKADGLGHYDIFMDFPQSFSQGRFDGSEEVVYLIKGKGTFTFSAYRFIEYNVPSGGNPKNFGAAHINGLPPPTGSIFTYENNNHFTPEPSTLAMFAAGLMLLVFAVRRRSLSTTTRD